MFEMTKVRRFVAAHIEKLKKKITPIEKHLRNCFLIYGETGG